MHTPWKNLTDNTKKPIDKLYWLIGINVVVFLVAIVVPSTDYYLLLPSSLPPLAIHFWTVLTYMFVHEGFLSILFNMLWLYWMGQLFEDYLGSKRIVGVYLLGGLAGAVLFILAFGILPAITHSTPIFEGLITGASASVLAIMAAIITLLPNNEIMLFIWPVKLKWLIVIYGIFDIINIRFSGFGTITAHIGAALFGFLYIKQLQKGRDWLAILGNVFKPRSPLKIASKNPMRKASYRPREDEVDEILDKISKTGYDSLNKEEKEILFRASKNES